MLGFDRGASECVRCNDDVSHSRGTIRPGSYGVVILQETIRVSHSQPSVSGVVLQEKAFEFDRLRLHDILCTIIIIMMLTFNDKGAPSK